MSDVTKLKRIEIQDLVNFPAGIDTIFPNLLSLFLDNLGIKKVHERNLAGFPKLIQLDLSYNQIEVLERDLFKNNPNLIKINLNTNELKIIDANVFDNLKYLRDVMLTGNFCINLSIFNRDKFELVVESIAKNCRLKGRAREEVTVRINKKFNWKKYFCYFVIFGATFSLLAFYCLFRIFCTVKVAPENRQEEAENKDEDC